jgi:hypothetical protein
MSKWDKLLLKILKGGSDANVSFEELRSLLIRIGFEERVRGSHHVFRLQGVAEKPNLQRSGSQAKPYQVKQVREIIIKNNLGEKLT